jgi:hypothetical protein
VTRSWISRVKPLVGLLAFVMAVTFTAPAYAADEAATVAPAAGPLRAAVEAKLSTTQVPAEAVTTQAAATEGAAPSKSFFRTGKGIAVIALMAGGVGYTLYSKSHDRIKSPIR